MASPQQAVATEGSVFLGVYAPAIVPLAVGILMNLLEGLVEPFNWQRRFERIGWDAAVLSVGLTAGVFSDPRVIAFYQPQGIAVAEVGCIIAELFCVMVMGYLRRRAPGEPEVGWKALLCVGLGGVALVVPIWAHAHALSFVRSKN
jgi:hypothetical protein